jgi:tryptophanyl-tRNA synthetase
MSRILTGDRPTGPLHIGHYVGTLANRVRLQRAGHEVFVVVADYQVITDRDHPGDLEATVTGIVLDYLASGLDPERTVVFAHSAVPALNQLLLPFLSLVSVAELDRNPTVKEEIRQTGRRAVSGLMLTYPAHQAADILFCQADLVPVGQDQLPHLELTRTIARRFNQRYGEVFRTPEALLGDVPTLAGLDGRKMSKSLGNAIALSDGPDVVAAKIRAARTDAEREITYEPVRRPEIATLLRLAAAGSGRPEPELAAEVGDRGAAALKALVIDALNDFLGPLQRRRARFIAADALEILRRGNAAANEIAAATLADVRTAMGMTFGAHEGVGGTVDA